MGPGRIDVVESVGDGVEEYYLGGGGTEARGQWMGAGALRMIERSARRSAISSARRSRCAGATAACVSSERTAWWRRRFVTGPHGSDPQLHTHVLVRARERLRDAERPGRAPFAATSRRRALEVSRTHWLPGRRGQLDALRRSEAAAARCVQDLRRQQGELRHGARPFVTERELDAGFAKTADRLAERRLQRGLARDMGHGLGR